MDIRRDRRGFSAAEGCMFAAVGLFVALLIALLVLAVLRARNPPDPMGPPRPPRQVGLAEEPVVIPHPSSVVHWSGTDDRRPTTVVAEPGGEAPHA